MIFEFSLGNIFINNFLKEIVLQNALKLPKAACFKLAFRL